MLSCHRCLIVRTVEKIDNICVWVCFCSVDEKLHNFCKKLTHLSLSLSLSLTHTHTHTHTHAHTRTHTHSLSHSMSQQLWLDLNPCPWDDEPSVLPLCHKHNTCQKTTTLVPRNTKGLEVSLYSWPPFWPVGISLFCKSKQKLSSCHTADSKPVKQEVNSTVILPPLVFPACTQL